MSRYLKSFIVVSIIFLVIGGYKIINLRRPLDDQVVHVNNYLSINYKTDSNSKFRYRYELKYTPVNDELNESLDREESLLILELNDKLAAEIKPTDTYSQVIPIVSDYFNSDDGAINDEFQIELISKNKNKDKIKFETKIILEELKGGKWSPVYQVIQMERGPYWSLDKGPVEFVNP